MKYGLDFGTSNSVISYNDGNTVKVLPIEPTNGTKEIMPSLWYFYYDEEFWSFGKSAYDKYKETLGEGRLIQSLKKYLSDPTLRNTYVHKRTVEFEEYIKDYTSKISNLVVTSLSAADLEPEHIDKILLVGGSSKIPVFRNLIAEFFPDAEILRVNEMTSIAHGLGCTP